MKFPGLHQPPTDPQTLLEGNYRAPLTLLRPCRKVMRRRNNAPTPHLSAALDISSAAFNS
ncbi:hypothetical protein FRC00_007231, partial [Tulasnella sp. 408]